MIVGERELNRRHSKKASNLFADLFGPLGALLLGRVPLGHGLAFLLLGPIL